MGSFTIRIFYLLLSYLMALPLCLEQRLQGYKWNILSHPPRSDLSPGLKIPTLAGDLGMAHAAQEEFVGSDDVEGISLPIPGQIWRLSPNLAPMESCPPVPGHPGETSQKRLQKPLPSHLH